MWVGKFVWLPLMLVISGCNGASETQYLEIRSTNGISAENSDGLLHVIEGRSFKDGIMQEEIAA